LTQIIQNRDYVEGDYSPFVLCFGSSGLVFCHFPT
jgi:hypothetical protein